MAITVAILGDTTVSLDNYCTKRGYTPLSLEDGSIYWQLCYFCANGVETITSPQAVLATSDVFTSWTQTGYKDDRPGSIRFDSSDGFLSMYLCLECHDGLYYCVLDVYTVGKDLQSTPPAPMSPKAGRVATTKPPLSLRCISRYTPTLKDKQLESELWLLLLGSPGVTQLDHLPGNGTGLPAEFNHHPFRFIDFKEQAMIRCQAAQRSIVRTSERKRRFYMDFGFMRASAEDYSGPISLKTEWSSHMMVTLPTC